MITLKDIKAENSTYTISLVKLTGLKVKDIQGYITCEFGSPVFQLSNIVFEDGTKFGCEGEHDMPYLVNYGDNENMSDETLQRLYDEENGPQD